MIEGTEMNDMLPFEEELKELDLDSEPETVPERSATTNIEIATELADIVQNAPDGVDILTKCINLAVFLSAKNTAYGNSALSPVRIFSKADTSEQLRVRIDDKLNRVMHGTEFPGDNDILDLVGYLILYLIQRDRDVNVETTEH